MPVRSESFYSHPAHHLRTQNVLFTASGCCFAFTEVVRCSSPGYALPRSIANRYVPITNSRSSLCPKPRKGSMLTMFPSLAQRQSDKPENWEIGSGKNICQSCVQAAVFICSLLIFVIDSFNIFVLTALLWLLVKCRLKMSNIQVYADLVWHLFRLNTFPAAAALPGVWLLLLVETAFHSHFWMTGSP